MELVIGYPCSLGIHVGLFQLPHCKICDLVLLRDIARFGTRQSYLARG